MRAENTNFRVVCAADNAEIYLYDVIGEDFFGGISSKMFADEMQKAKGAKTIDLHINSPGGNVFDGFTMYSLLKSSKANINVLVDGLAASIASVIAMAGDNIEMSTTGMMMIHDPMGYVGHDSIGAGFGNAEDHQSMVGEHQKMQEMLDTIKSQIAGVYMSRTGMDEKQISKMMSAETWMTPQDAMDMKFCDCIGPDMKMAACLRSDLFKYKNMPKDFGLPQATSEEIELRKRKELREKIDSSLKRWRNEHATA